MRQTSFRFFSVAISLVAISSLGLACAKKESGEAETSGRLAELFKKKNDATSTTSSVSELAYGGANPLLIQVCLAKEEQKAKVSGLLPAGVSCSDSYIADPDASQTQRRVCSDDLPKACGIDPIKTQKEISKLFPKGDTAYLPPYQQCMVEKEADMKRSEQMPSRLSCGQPVVGYSDQQLLSKICTDTLHDQCKQHLPADVRDLDKQTAGITEDGKGNFVKSTIPAGTNPSCAPNNVGVYNEDCSKVTVRGTTYTLSPMQMCMNSQIVERRKTHKMSDGRSNWYCGMLVIRDDDQRFLENQCEIITNDCLKMTSDSAPSSD